MTNISFPKTAYDTMKLIQEVTSKANLVIQEMQSSLTVAEIEKLPRYNPISHFAIKNGRRKMEDRHVVIHDLNTLYGMNVRELMTFQEYSTILTGDVKRVKMKERYVWK